MRAVIVKEFGEVDAASVGEFPDPVPNPDEVLVRVHAVAANFVDLLVIGGKYQFLPEPPFVPGKGPAGVVVGLGADVTGFEIGDRVLAMAEMGGYAELVAVEQSQVYRLPANLSFADAASMALVYDTAWVALRDRARISAGETVLVLGATGGVGYASVQLANAMGAKVLAGISSPDKASLIEDDADAVIDLSIPDLKYGLREQVYAATDGAGADIILDPLGDDIFDAAIRALAWRGRLVVIGFAAGRIPTIRANYLLLKNIEVSGLQVSDYRKRAKNRMSECFEEVFQLYDRGKIKPGPTTTFALDGFAEALRSVEQRRIQGRAILIPTE
ncbi:MAG: NADPH:quinone oxidoreductase family protein [Alphaproteobacteria bacterium]|nr:NADPH:quinone oxidoreductase family protein [Alphaproteobacteria bacterium]